MDLPLCHISFCLQPKVSIHGSTMRSFPTVRLYIGIIRIFRGDWTDCIDDSNTV